METELTQEGVEDLAQQWMGAADSLSRAESSLRNAVYDPRCQALRDHVEVVDALTGPEIREVVYRLREAAMLLDRAALTKHCGE